MEFSKSRLEAFSDGVIAIILTLMILEFKVPDVAPGEPASEIWRSLGAVLPTLLVYAMSFIIVAIMWINHHHTIHLVRHVDTPLLWLNINFLFWMSLVPFPTAFLGRHVDLPEACLVYGGIGSLISVAFTLFQRHAQRLMGPEVSDDARRRINTENVMTIALYAVAGVSAYLSVIVSWSLFVLLPALYFLPERVARD